MDSDNLMGLVNNAINMKINENYQIIKLIGCGGYGCVFLAKSLKRDQNIVVAKLEFKKTRSNSLEKEMAIYKQLGHKNCIPRIFSYGICELGPYIIMEQLGPNLQQLFEKCGNKFSLRSVIMLAHTLLFSLKKIHDRNVLHCDIKPENIVVGLNQRNNRLYLVDFGLAQLNFCSNKENIENKDENDLLKKPLNNFRGSVEFCALNVHKCKDLSFKDDLEALGYLLIYLAKGSLPWSSCLEAKSKLRETERNIYKLKKNTTWNFLCFKLPREFNVFFQYVKNLNPSDTPNYNYLRFLFRNLYDHLYGKPMDYIYDWLPKQ